MLCEHKCVSERHDAAIKRGLLTAGQMASKLNREFRPATRIKAAELKPYATEWHHSGFMPSGRSYSGSRMGRTYFFDPDANLSQLYALVEAERAEAARVAAESDVERYYFEPEFERLSRSSHWQRKWRVYATFGVICAKPSEPLGGKKTEISRAEYEAMAQFEGRDLEAYETFVEFRRRMEAEHDC